MRWESTSSYLISFLLSIILPCLSSCTNNQKNSEELSDIDQQASLAMATYEKEGLDSLGNLLLTRSVQTHNKTYEAKAHLYLSSYKENLSDKNIKDRLTHLDKAELIAKELNNDTLLCFIYNLRGVWELNQYNNFPTAQYYFSRSLEKASKLQKRHFSIPAEMNMSEVCRVTGDTLGLKYDRELFEYARTTNQPLLLFTAGLHCANYYALTAKDTLELLPYIEAMKSQNHAYEGAVEMIYAKFFYHKGDFDKAEEYIKRTDTSKFTDYEMLNAKILSKLNKFQESEKILDSLKEKLDNLNFSDRDDYFLLRVSNMEALGNWESAFTRQKEYEVYRDSMERIANEDLLKRYRIEYEGYSKDRQIEEQQTRIFNMRIIITLSILLIIVIITGYTLYYFRKRKHFKDIVRQNIDFLKQNREAEKRIAFRDERILELEENLKKLNDTTKEESALLIDANSERKILSEEKIDLIFEKIRNLTEKDKVWKDLSITRDSFAEKVGCNRTYLAEVLKVKTGMGYSQYMNSCRIKEAIKILSDPDNDISLNDLYSKLGFLSIGTFHKVFKQFTGISPSAFRQTARELHCKSEDSYI